MIIDTYESLSSCIDVHLLDPFLSADEVFEACSAAREDQVRAVVVRPCDLQLVSGWMRGSSVVVASTAGYPDGTSTTGSKLFEGRDVLRLGAAEVEFVLNPASMISRQFQAVEAELLQIAKSCHETGGRLTVVYNSSRLPDDLKIIATKICKRVEADTISIDGGQPELDLLKPILKDVLQLKLRTPAVTLADALAARTAGYRSFAVADPGSMLRAWREHLASANQPVTS